jgi:hypothetical protein
MGWNTTVVVLNDALSFIENDPEFGKRLARAVRASVNSKDCPVRVSAGNFSSAALVIETHDADYEATIKVGGNTGRVMGK